MKPSVALLVPAYNEEATLEETVVRSLKVARDCVDDFEIVVLDDASSDRTPEIIARLQADDPEHVRALRHEANLGIGATFEDLYRAARKDYVFLIPADNEFPPEALRQIVPMLADYDIVVCRRLSKPYSTWRAIVSGGYRWLPRLLFGVDLYDAGSLKCMNRRFISEITITSKGVFAEAERLIRAVRRGYRLGVVDIRQDLRRAGIARGARLSVVARAFLDLLMLWGRLAILRQRP